MAGIDLGSIIQSLGQLSQVQRQQTDEIAGRRAMQGEIGEEIARNLWEVAERQERVETQELEGLLEAQQQSRRVARAAGMDASYSNEIISGMMGGMRSDIIAYDAASRQAQAMEERGNLLANPLGWLNNVLNGPQVQATRDATAERLQQSQAQLNNMHALTQANVQTQNAIAETMTAATIKDQARANALLAESKALEAEQNAQEYTIAGIETLREYGSVEFNRRLQVGNQVRQQQQHEQSMAMRQAELEMRRQAMEMEMEANQSWEELAAIANETSERLGLQGPRVTGGMVKQHWGQNTPVGQRVMSLVDRGLLARDTGQNILGRNAYDTVTFADSFGVPLPPNLDPDAVAAIEEARATLAQELAEAERFIDDIKATEHGLTRNNMDSPDARARVFNSVVGDRLRIADSRFDEYKINTPIITQEYPQLGETNYFETVVEPLASTDDGFTIKDAAAQTAEKFAAGELSTNEAVEGLRALWQAQRDLFNATNGRDAIGVDSNIDEQVPRLLVGEKYRAVGAVAAQTGLMSFDLSRSRDLKSQELYERVDLTDPNAVTRYLINYRSNKLARQMQESANQ